MLLQEVEADFVGSFFPRGYTLWKRIKGITRWINLAAIDPRSTWVMNPSRRTNESGRFLSSVSYATGCVCVCFSETRIALPAVVPKITCARRDGSAPVGDKKRLLRGFIYTYLYRYIYINTCRKKIFSPISKRARSSQTYFIYFSKLTRPRSFINLPCSQLKCFLSSFLLFRYVAHSKLQRWFSGIKKNCSNNTAGNDAWIGG